MRQRPSRKLKNTRTFDAEHFELESRSVFQKSKSFAKPELFTSYNGLY